METKINEKSRLYQYIGYIGDKYGMLVESGLTPGQVAYADPTDFLKDVIIPRPAGWGGVLPIKELLEDLNCKIEAYRMLENPIQVYGDDYDCGHTYPWEHEIKVIFTLKENA